MAPHSQLAFGPMEGKSIDPAGQSRVGSGQRELTSLLAESVSAVGCTDKEAAYAQGIDPAHWSRIKSGEKQAHLDRLARLPEKVQREFIRRYAQELKMSVSEQDARERAALDLAKAAIGFLEAVK